MRPASPHWHGAQEYRFFTHFETFCDRRCSVDHKFTAWKSARHEYPIPANSRVPSSVSRGCTQNGMGHHLVLALDLCSLNRGGRHSEPLPGEKINVPGGRHPT